MTQSAVGYAGDLSPSQAWDLLAAAEGAVLVDVRSRPEWSFVGLPDLSSLGKRPLLVAWQDWVATDDGATMLPNPAFADTIAAALPDPKAPVIFLCRSGARSRAAAIAMTQRGYAAAYNLAGGFEGGHDATRHRGRVEGWKAAGLPWVQS